MAITSVHECPVSKLQMKYCTPFIREKRKLRASESGDQQQLANGTLNYFRFGRNDASIKWYLEDEIALAKNRFWRKKQRIYNKASNKAMRAGKKKFKNEMESMLNRKYPRWYQEFSLDQMKNLKNLENVMRTDYEETKTDGTQNTLMAIGIISTFFKLKPNIINKLHKSCNLNSVDFLREIYKILTGNDFYEEEYKKFYDCNERIILSAIAFLTLPETVNELHKRLPAMIVPSLPPKPKLICFPRRKSSCPYKEDLFKSCDWAGYRNALQKWQKQYKLFQTIPTLPEIILFFKQHDQIFTNDRTLSCEIRKQKEDIYINYNVEKTNTQDLQNNLQNNFSNKYDAEDVVNIDKEVIHETKDSTTQKNFKVEKSSTSNNYQILDDDKKLDSTINGNPKITKNPGNPEPGTMTYKICTPKPPGTDQKSWLDEKNAYYIIAGATSQNETPLNCPVTYEIAGVANVTPTNSDEKFFAMLKLDDKPEKIFPSGRENLSRKWQDWLRNADEDYEQMEEKADELMKSIQTTIKLASPEPVCDSCCSCRQTRKADEKLEQSKILIDNAAQNSEKNEYIEESMAMHSSEPAESPINLIASQSEIKTNIIINGVTKENGQIRYYVSGVQKDNMQIPSQILDPPAFQLVKNVPPCRCAIRQMINKDISPSISEDDIQTKDEGVCIGKKYRPDKPGAYSCKTYPDDKSCRHNPFMKELIKMEKNKKEKEKRKEDEEKANPIEEIKKEIQTLMKEITEEKKNKFVPNPDYPNPAYDNSWNKLRIAPSKIIERDYGKNLKLTPPAFHTISSSLNMQEKQKDISFLQGLKKDEKNILNKEDNKKNFESSLKLSKNNKKERNKNKEELKNMENKIRKEWISSKKITNKKSTNLSNKVFKNGTKKKQQTKLFLSSFHNPVKRFDRVDKLTKYNNPIKKNKETVTDETKLYNCKQEMAKIKNMFKSFPFLDDIQSAILPKELLAISRHNPEEIIIDSSIDEENNCAINKAPWRTKSEQELPAKKTLTYLCEPDYPLETVAVSPGGRPCQCRENRNKKKILVYNMAGVVEKKIAGRRVRKTKLEEENRIIDGVLYVTPPISPRRSDEYIPEYDLLESPYDMCNNVTDDTLKLIERYSGPKSLVEKIQKKSKSCSCTNGVKEQNHLVDQKKDIAEARQKLMESKLPEERWKMALKDAALMDYFTQRKNNVPCWTSCKKFARNARSRKLKVVKPVCECKYERKIVERNEERIKWKTRQERLKALKKQPFMHIVDISRPMIEDTNFIVSGEKTTPLEDEHKEDIKCYASDEAKNISMLPPQQIIDGLKMSTPVQTPQPSREHIRADIPHRHWSPINISSSPLPRLKEEIEHRKNIRDEAFRLMYENKNEQDVCCNCQEVSDKKNLIMDNKTNLSQMNVEKEMSIKIIELNNRKNIKQSPSKEIDYKIEARKNKPYKKNPKKKKYKKGTTKIATEIATEIAQHDVSDQQIIDKIGKEIKEKIDETHLISDDEKHIDSNLDLMAIIKVFPSISFLNPIISKNIYTFIN
ncbi:uncharacterized protein LOC126857042 [Cataglyphis hispanica]|uniref:uncharacterized protein LOC126857042 n=1 Tax=Cataglyphis hispanica TaxID=1086592 RepID=UPI0021801520|nr:uncharacterized protein LOC126857042 [Cataglyphis hispanica]